MLSHGTRSLLDSDVVLSFVSFCCCQYIGTKAVNVEDEESGKKERKKKEKEREQRQERRNEERKLRRNEVEAESGQ